MKGQLRIDTLFAFIVVDDDGTEGVPAIMAPAGAFGPYPTLLPLMGADSARIDSLRQYVEHDPLLKGKTIILAKFAVREDIEVIAR